MSHHLRSQRRRSCTSPSSSGVTVAGSTCATSRPRSITCSVSDMPDQLFEVGGDQQHGQTAGARVAQVLPDGRLGADVDAPRGVGGDQHRGLAAHLPADDELLLVATGQRERRYVDAGGAHVVRADDALGVVTGALAVDPAASGTGPAGSGGRGCGSPTAGTSAAAPAGAGPRGCSRCRPRGVRRVVQLRDVLVAEREPSPDVGVRRPMMRLDQLGLAVALDPGDADDLAAVDRRGSRRRAGAAADERSVRQTSCTLSTTTSVTVDSRVSGVGSSLPTISSARSGGR